MPEQKRADDRPEIAFALTMIATLVVIQAITLIVMPGKPDAQVCRMEISGPLARTCAE